MKKTLNLIVLVLLFLVVPVNASNKINYRLEITKDYKFNETIYYEIDNYSKVKNGDNEFLRIINNDVLVDILGKEKYSKTKRFNNDKYYVTLKHTYSEYSLSNSRFLNNCFQTSKYDYDVDKITFSGNGGFNCYMAENFKITIVSAFPITDSNAVVSGNTYVWTPNSYDFNMKLTLNKSYEKTENENRTWDDPVENKKEDDNDDNTNNDTGIDNSDNTQNESKIGDYIVIGLGIIVLISLPIIAIILKKKKDALDEI